MSENNTLENLVPLVQAIDCQTDDPRVHRSFFHEPKMSLTVFYALVQPSRNLYLTHENFPSLGVDMATLEATCINNWLRDHTDLPWESIDIEGGPPVMAARSQSDNMATILLSHGHLKGMHKHFGEQILYLGIPDRFTVLVHSNPLVFGGLVQGMYRDAVKEGTQFSCDMYCSMEAKIVAKTELAPAMPAGTELIENMIAHIFLMVSAADGNIDDKEVVQFLKTLSKFARGGQGVVHQASQSMLRNELAVLKEVMIAPMDQGSPSFLKECAKKLKANLDEKEYAETAQLLNSLAETIAKASGSFFSRNKVSGEEAVALFMIAAALH